MSLAGVSGLLPTSLWFLGLEFKIDSERRNVECGMKNLGCLHPSLTDQLTICEPLSKYFTFSKEYLKTHGFETFHLEDFDQMSRESLTQSLIDDCSPDVTVVPGTFRTGLVLFVTQSFSRSEQTRSNTCSHRRQTCSPPSSPGPVPARHLALRAADCYRPCPPPPPRPRRLSVPPPFPPLALLHIGQKHTGDSNSSGAGS